MSNSFIYTSTLFSQGYGVDSYGAVEYSCNQADTACIEAAQNANQGGGGQTGTDGTQTTTAAAPNTGVFGLSSDAALASVSGALLLAIAIVGIVYVVLSRSQRKKKQGR